MTQPQPHILPATSKASSGVLYSTTEGRQRFPDILQTTFGDKAVIGFGRYGRAIGAVVPMEAVRILAGFGEIVDEDIRRRIERTAKSLLELLPAEAALCGLQDGGDEPELTEVADVAARRTKERQSVAAPRPPHL